MNKRQKVLTFITIFVISIQGVAIVTVACETSSRCISARMSTAIYSQCALIYFYINVKM